jgi:hypothetical protein
MCFGPSDILTNLLSRYFSITKAADTIHVDQMHLRETIMEIARLRQGLQLRDKLLTDCHQQIADLRAELTKTKAFVKV